MIDSLEFKHLLIGFFIVVSVAGGLAAHFLIRKKAGTTVAGRAALTAEEFAALFEDEKERQVAPLIRDRLRAYIPVNPALVRPDDKLCEELQLAVIDGLDANAFVRDVEKIANVAIPDNVAEKMYTLRDIISYAAAHKR